MKRIVLAVMGFCVCAVCAAAEWGWSEAASSVVRFDARASFGGLLVRGTERIGTPDGASTTVWDTTQVADGWHERTAAEVGSNVTTRLYALNGAAFRIEEGRLAADAVWGPDATHVLRNWVVVPRGVTLTVTTNTVVKMLPETGIRIEDGGRLDVVGAADCDVIFTSVADAAAGAALADLAAVSNRAVGGIVRQTGAATFTDNTYVQTRNFGGNLFPSVTLNDTTAIRNGGLAYLVFTVSGTREAPFEVDWVAHSGTATFGDDYKLASGKVRWNKTGDGTKTVAIPLNAANVTGETRTFTVEIVTNRAVNVARRMATVTIQEREAMAFEWSAATESAAVRFDTRTNTPGRVVHGVERVANGGNDDERAVADWDTTTLADGWNTLTKGTNTLALLTLNDPHLAVEEGRLAKNTLWASNATHVLRNTVVVPRGVTLTVTTNAVVKFMEGTGIKIEDGGKLNVVGTPGEDVIFTAANDGTAGASVPGVGEGEISHRGFWKQSAGAAFADNGFIQTRNWRTGLYPEVWLNDTTAFRSTGMAAIPVTINGTRDQVLSIEWRAVDGTAKYGVDYTLKAGRVAWNKANEGTKIIEIPLVKERVVGTPVSFTLEITVNRGVNVSRRTCVVEIREFKTRDFASAHAASATTRFDARRTMLFRVCHGTEWIAGGLLDTTTFKDGWRGVSGLDAGTNATTGIYCLNRPQIAVEEGRLARNTLWTSNATHVLRNWVVVPRGVTLTVTTNAVVKMFPETGIRIEDGGRLDVVGAPGADVVFTSVADDTAGEPIAGFESITNRLVGGIVAQSGAATFTDNAWIQTRSFGWAPGYGTVTLHDAAADRANGVVYVPLTIATNRKQPFSVDWVATDGTAKHGTDYTDARGTVTWNKADDGTKWIRLPLTPQKTGERRTFTLALTVAHGILVARGTATVTIDELDAAKTHGAVTLVEGVEASRPFSIDALVGDQPIFLADAVPVTYSGRWQAQRAAQETITRVSVESDNGLVRLGEFPGDVEGMLTLDLSGYRTGCYTLRHEILAKGEEKPLHTTTKTFSVVDRDDVELHGGTLTGNEVWKAGKVHVVYATVVVPGIYTLFIEPGAIVKFMTGTGIDISQGGALFANAIVFTHINDDTVGGDTLADGYTVAPPMDAYFLSGNFTFGDDAELRNVTQKTALTGTLNGTKMLSKGSTYRVGGTFTVANGATLTIPAGTVLKMEQGAQIVVNAGGTLKANGTRAAPVVFTSINDDSYSGKTEGSNSNPQPGDWKRIDIAGTATFDFTRIAFASDTGDRGAINGTGGTITFDNGVVESMRYECVRINRGSFVSRNSVFRDAAMGFGYYGGSGTYVYNGVVADCTIACRASNKHFVNTVFYNCLTFLESTSSSADHCAFYNPPDRGAQTATQVGKNGNIWGDPLFVDAANGDFRIREGSPCVDAADSSAAPELDYFGQPRITFTGRTNDTELAGGPLADIGICEVMPRDVTSDIDLVPEAVRTEKTATPGQLLFVKWEVRNQGGAPVDATWRDTVSLVSQDGREVVLGDKATKSAIAVGGSVFCSGYFTVPAMAEGTWYPKVNVNSYHDIFEGSLTSNNALVGTGGVEVAVKETESEGEEGVINAGTPTVKKITLPETGGNRMVHIKVPAGVTIRWGFGFVPTGNQKSGTLTSNGQDAIFRVPDGVTDVYVSLESDDGAEYDLSLEEGQVVITGVSPNTLPSSGEVTITIDGAGFTEDNKVYLVNGAGEIAPKSVQYVSSHQLVAKVDCGKLTKGAAYGVSVIDTVNVVKENAVAVLSTLKPGKLYFELQSPVNARIGREYPCSISYGNVGELPINVPVLQVSISGTDGTRRGSLGYVGGLSGLDRLSFVGAGQNPLAGMLLPGETHSIEFIYHAGDSDKIKLHAYSEDNNSRIDWNGTEVEFAEISQMASRLGLAGLNASDCDLVLDAALSSNQVHNSFVSGKLVSFDQTKEAGVLRLVGESGMYHATIAGNGCFSFAGVEAGTYDVIHSHSHVEPSTITVQKGKDVFELELKVPSEENCVVSVLNAAEGDAVVTCMDLAYEKQFEARKVSSGEYVFTGLPEGNYSIHASDSEGKMAQAYFAASGNNLICQIQMELKPGLSISGVIKNRVSFKECAVVLRNGVNVDVKSVATDGRFEYVGLPEDYYSLALYFVDENGQIRFENIETIDLKSTGSVVREYEVGGSVPSLKNCQRAKNTSAYSTVSKSSSDYHWYDPDAAYKMFMDFYYECYAEWSKNGVHKPAPDLQCEHNVLKYYQDLVMWNTYRDVLLLYLKGASKTSGWLFIAETSNLLHKFSDLTFDLFVDAYCGAAKGVYEAALKGMWSSITSLGKDYATEQILDDDGNVLMGSGDVQELKEKLDYYFSIAGKSDLAVDSARSLTYTLQKFQGRKKFWSKIGKYSKFGKGLAVLQNINSCLSLGKGFVENYDAAVRMWNARDDWNNSIEAMRDITKQLAIYRVRFNAAASQFNNYKKCGCMSPMPLPQDSPYVENQISNPQSCDPNEMSGPLGLGDPETERYVKPGEWMTYTVYFENRADATAAAQEVRVTNPLSPYLDWSTFEMGEVAFNNQIDLGLSGRRGGTSEAAMKGTNTLVRTQLTLDDATGTAEWYLRIVDPTTATGWPEDVFAGFLPPNDETFRGEGHLTYRVKVRDDAPHGVRIDNSASIVFDYNEPIETDPSWWNMVARTLEAGFVEPEVTVEEGGTATIAVRGGSAERETSVQVSLAYQTASAADLDLKNAKVDGATPKGGVKFPLTLTWAAGEIGAKTITIPVKADRAVENEELFTLQLANAQGMGVGDASCCTVTIRDANAAADYAARQGKTTVRTKKGVPDCALSIACVAMDGSGEPCGFTTGQGSYYAGCKASLKAAARPGWTFAGWGEVEDGVTNVVSDKASWSVAVTDDADIIAFFDRIPYVRGLAHLADRGKVTGSGYCPAGKKVTLRATANRGYVFEGWYGAKDGNAGEIDLSGQPVAKTPALIVDRTARPAKSDARQTVITEVDGSVTYFAKFITNREDIEAVSLDLDGVPLSAEDAFATNLICGVAVDWPVVSGGLSATTVRASGLPAGLKLVQDRATRAYSVVGVPTAASKVDKSGNVKPSVAKFTVTTAGRNARTFVVEIAVSPLPTWAVGSFDGAVQMGDIVGAASMTVAANGRVSGKYGLCGTNWTFSASGYTEFIDDDIETNRLFALDVMAKSGRMLRDLRIEVTPGWMADIVAYRFPDAWIMEEDARAYAESLGMSWPYDPPLECVTQEVSRINCSQANGADVADAALMLHRGIWKDRSAKSRKPMVDGLFDWWPVLEPWRNWVFDAENFPDVKMSVATSGRVSFAGKLPDGVRASSSTTAYLVPESGHPRALFIVPTTKNAAGLLDEVVCPHDDL